MDSQYRTFQGTQGCSDFKSSPTTAVCSNSANETAAMLQLQSLRPSTAGPEAPPAHPMPDTQTSTRLSPSLVTLAQKRAPCPPPAERRPRQPVPPPPNGRPAVHRHRARPSPARVNAPISIASSHQRASAAGLIVASAMLRHPLHEAVQVLRGVLLTAPLLKIGDAVLPPAPMLAALRAVSFAFPKCAARLHRWLPGRSHHATAALRLVELPAARQATG